MQKTPIFDLFRRLLLFFADFQASFFIVLRTCKASFLQNEMRSCCLPPCRSTNFSLAGRLFNFHYSLPGSPASDLWSLGWLITDH
jgi:hypothetical protein